MSALLALGLWATLETMTVRFTPDHNPAWPGLLAQALDLKGKSTPDGWLFQVPREQAPIYARLFGHLSYVADVSPAPVPKPDPLPDHVLLPSPGPSGQPPAYWPQRLPQPQAVRVDFRPPVERRVSLFTTLFQAAKVRSVNRHTFDLRPPAGLTPVEAAEAWRLSPWVRLAEPVVVP